MRPRVTERDEAAPADPPRPYHHGALREALLDAAAQILERKGVDGLTLRAAARAAGASHAAPKNHFGDLTGLLSELAAAGYERFTDRLQTAGETGETDQRRLNAIGRAYVEFAIENPGLFQLMFRGERLDLERPALKQAMLSAQYLLTGAVVAAHPPEGTPAGGPGPTEAYAVRAWAMVHGFAMLLLDDRLSPLLQPGAGRDEAMAMLDAILRLD
jgi:AcrR family transcriptional regulator